jgi:hypothetical protein
MVAIDQFLEELCLLNLTFLRDFFRTFVFPLFTDIHFMFDALLCHTKIQIKFEFGFDPMIFHEVMALGLRKILRSICFPHFLFSLLIDIHLIFDTLLCYTKLQIKYKFAFDPLNFHKVMAHELRKIF